MNKFRLLDLFCGAGGAAMGYHRAGFEVVGVDIKPQPHYPFEFFQKDWHDALMTLGPLFDVIHASPPCQHYTVGKHIHNSGDRHPDLVALVRDALKQWQGQHRKPWVIENVPGAPLWSPVVLCGTMFGLKVFRHRLFESNPPLEQPTHGIHDGSTGAKDGYSTRARGRNGYICVAGHNFIREEAAEAMGIDWMKSRHELAQAIPPAYCEFIGKQLMRVLMKEAH
ncbi:MAG: DNA cytosine methyltransferase [Planctomycetaceae bacterium]|nr:MAG: DNA cytosine methyltransferase [Planctomycetaceae bacterium]